MVTENEDIFDQVLREIGEGKEPQEPAEPVNTDLTTEQPPVVTEPTVNTDVTTLSPEQPKFDLNNLPTEKQLEVFNKITGLQLSNIDDAKRYADVFDKLPGYQKMIELYPVLVEKLKTAQDPLSFFPDERSYLVAQLIKKEEYKGKAAELTKLFQSDLSTLPAMDIVKLSAPFISPEGVKNPLRYTIRQMGLDPEEVLNNFDQLSEDDQDLFLGFAEKQRKELRKIGQDIEIPKSPMTGIEETIEAQLKATKDDLLAKKSQLVPVMKTVVDGIKEIKINDEFNFEVEMSEEDKQGYSEFMTQSILNGDFNISTDEGKKELYEAVIDEIWIDQKQKIIKSLETKLRNKLEKEFRDKYDNAKPLEGKTPKPVVDTTRKVGIVDVIEEMVNQY